MQGVRITSTALLLGLMSSPALADIGAYIAGRGGLSYMPELTIKNTAGSENKFKLNYGYYFGGAAGFTLVGPLRLELEGNYQTLQMDEIEIGSVTAEGDGSVDFYSGFFNTYLDIPVSRNFYPYVGGGIGYAGVQAEVKANGTQTLDDQDQGLIYQGLAGFRYKLSDEAVFSLGYRYQRMDGLSMTDVAGNSAEVDMQGHAVHIGFTLPFGPTGSSLLDGTLFGTDRAVASGIGAGDRAAEIVRSVPAAATVSYVESGLPVLPSSGLPDGSLNVTGATTRGHRGRYGDLLRPEDSLRDPVIINREVVSQVAALQGKLELLEDEMQRLAGRSWPVRPYPMQPPQPYPSQPAPASGTLSPGGGSGVSGRASPRTPSGGIEGRGLMGGGYSAPTSRQDGRVSDRLRAFHEAPLAGSRSVPAGEAYGTRPYGTRPYGANSYGTGTYGRTGRAPQPYGRTGTNPGAAARMGQGWSSTTPGSRGGTGRSGYQGGYAAPSSAAPAPGYGYGSGPSRPLPPSSGSGFYGGPSDHMQRLQERMRQLQDSMDALMPIANAQNPTVMPRLAELEAEADQIRQALDNTLKQVSRSVPE